MALRWSSAVPWNPSVCCSAGHDAAGRETEIRVEDGPAVRQVWDALHRLSSQTVMRAGGAEGPDVTATAPVERVFHHAPLGLSGTTDGAGGVTVIAAGALDAAEVAVTAPGADPARLSEPELAAAWSASGGVVVVC